MTLYVYLGVYAISGHPRSHATSIHQSCRSYLTSSTFLLTLLSSVRSEDNLSKPTTFQPRHSLAPPLERRRSRRSPHSASLRLVSADDGAHGASGALLGTGQLGLPRASTSDVDRAVVGVSRAAGAQGGVRPGRHLGEKRRLQAWKT